MKNNIVGTVIIIVFVLFCIIGIPVMYSFGVFNTKSSGSSGPPIGLAEINVDNGPMKSISLNDKHKFELNNISTVNKIKLINCKITLYKDLDYTGEKENFQHVSYAYSGDPWLVKEFDGTNNNNLFKSLVIEAM